jgi:ribosomal-protein-alanine N-acetyltransferase
MPPTAPQPPKAPERLLTARLELRRPTVADAEAIFQTYAADPEVTPYVGFPRHRRLEDTEAFLRFADAQWSGWPAGPYLVFLRQNGVLAGSSGLMFDTPYRAQTGYVFARKAWGQGYATEALGAMTALAPACGVRRLYAICHHAHRPSARVLEKGGFALEGVLRRYAEFPNLEPVEPHDCLCYARIF